MLRWQSARSMMVAECQRRSSATLTQVQCQLQIGSGMKMQVNTQLKVFLPEKCTGRFYIVNSEGFQQM